MSIKRPGGFELTDHVIDLCKFPEGAGILDIGCGEGDTCLHLQEKYGYQVTGIDTSPLVIEEGLKRHPGLDLRVGDGEFLEDFPSASFDGVMMECVLSLTNMPEEALHEAYCVLRKGGKLIVTDLYRKDADQGLITAAKINADRSNLRPKHHGECDETRKERPSEYRVNNLLLIQPLSDEIERLGFAINAWEDRSSDLASYAAEIIMEKGSLEGAICREDRNKHTGYFMMVATKL